jgi:hypothetical protein
MRQIGEIVAGLEHGGVHQGGQVRVIARLDGEQRRLNGLGLQDIVSGCGGGGGAKRADGGADGGHTSPLSSLKTSLTLSPSICFSETSEATQPSVTSGCHARVPMS